MQKYEVFRSMIKKQKAYQYALNVVGWDSNTEAPKKAFARRAEMMGVLHGEVFKMKTSKDYGDLVNELYNHLDTLDNAQKREVKKAKKALDKITKIPEDEYVAYGKLIQLSQKAWEEAKNNEDWEGFKDNLKKIVDYNRKFIDYYGFDMAPYDVLLDEYEEGMTMRDFDHFFDVLKKELVPFVQKVLGSDKSLHKPYIDAKYDVNKQKAFCEYLLDVFAFDKDRGGMKVSAHPFTWNTHPSDVRFTTRYLENYLFSSIFAAIHELGHATYEQQIDEQWNDTLLNGGTSMGIHESQSRFYENIIGRSKSFWKKHLEELKGHFPEQLKGVSTQSFYEAVNTAEATFIRVEADELTYPLHILLRYEIEKALFSKEIEVEDLPKLWNDKMETYLGIRPKTYSEGVLQDVHWSAGLLGYFPTYALGSAYAAQLYYAMKKEFDLESLIENDQIGKVNDWLKEKVHQYGSSKSPKELIEEVTKEPFDPMYYVRFLKEKYTKLYLEG
jgi:carboxypeptidase Taq